MSEIHKKDTPLLFGLLVKKHTSDGIPYVKFNWGRIILLFTIIIVFSWLSLATMLYAYFKHIKDLKMKI